MISSRPVSFAVLIALLSTAALADRQKPRPRSAFSDYVRARAADDLGELTIAATGYAAAMKESPSDTALKLRAFRQAMAAGDMALAAESARALDAAQSLPPDGTLLLLADALSRKDWKQALSLTTRIDSEKLFAFTTPVIRAWIAFETRKGDPLTILGAVQPASLAAGYAAEHRALLLLATGKYAQGAAVLNSLELPEGGRGARLRIAAAAILQAHHKTEMANAILVGASPAIDRAKADIAAHRKVKGAVDKAGEGVAELFCRIAADINKEQAAPLALGFARMATLLAPDDSEAWLLTGGLLGVGGAEEAGLAATSHVPSNDPFIGSARDQRLTLLVRLKRTDEALAEAQAATKDAGAQPGDWARLGDLLSTAKRPAEAADAYAQALKLSGGQSAPSEVAWPLLLQQASALLDAGDWPAARSAASDALKQAPQQPAVLNFLGYSQLEHGEDVVTAASMIARASAIAPDDASITDSLGWSWYLRGNLAQAIPLLERAARGAPAEGDINEHLGDAYWKAGRGLDARYAWRAALIVSDGDQASRLRAKIDYGLSGKP